jgi:hypothetical protein
VPTRVNSPSDIALASRESASSDLTFSTTALNPTFSALNSVQPGGIHPKPNQTTGGNGPVTGEEVQFNVSFSVPFDLPADHYFFVPQVLTSTGNFLWLSAPKPIVAPGTPFSPDLQSWTRDANLDPDWLRIGTDIVGGTPAPTFNGTFSLTGETFTPQITSLSQTSAVEGSSALSLTVSGSNFTGFSTVLFNGAPLATTFASATGQLTATVPAALLAAEGNVNVTAVDAQRGLSNVVTFTIADSVPTVTQATASLARAHRNATVSGMFSDMALEDHHVLINWGDGASDVVNLGTSTGGPFSMGHRYRGIQPRSRIITVTAVDDRGVASSPVNLTVQFRKR